MEIRVSYVLATRNRLEFIRRSLPMWKELKGPQDELVIVDGASTDGSYELMRDAEPGLIDVLIHEKDRSEAHAINKGFLAARGRYIKCITDDDIYYRAPLEQAYQAMDEHPEIDVLVTGGESINQIEDTSNLKPVYYQWFADDARLNDNYTFITMIGLGIIVRRSSLSVIGLFDPRHFHADTSYFTQATVRGACMRYIRVKGFSHRVGKQSVSLLNVPKKYIYDSFGFRGRSRWRYFLARPKQLKQRLLVRLGLVSEIPTFEPEWDAHIID